MVPVEKMYELGAVVAFWKVRIDALTAELGVLQALRAHSRPGNNRYAADRLLREIKRKSIAIGDAKNSSRQAQHELDEALDSAGHFNRVYVPVLQGHSAL